MVSYKALNTMFRTMPRLMKPMAENTCCLMMEVGPIFQIAYLRH